MKTKIIKLIIYFLCGLIVIIAAITGANETNNSTGGSSSGAQLVEVANYEYGTVGGDKYREWYTGDADGQPWCATFISWCAQQCGLIEQDIIPKFQGCNWGVSWFQEKGLFRYTPHYGGEAYTPKTGDIVFYSGSHIKSDSSHVGIVQYVEGDYVITIEGNTSNSVLSRSYLLTNPYILGYATPEYPAAVSGELSGSTNSEIAWNYFISMGCNEYATAGILGNLRQESQINPTSEQSGGPGRGIAQWEVGSDRYNALLTWAAGRGEEWTSMEIQLEFLWHELNGGETTCFLLLNRNYGGISGFKNAESIEWAVEAFEKSFERAGSPMMENRIQYANEYYELYQQPTTLEVGAYKSSY